jgi:predicted nucleic acid-binding protein
VAGLTVYLLDTNIFLELLLDQQEAGSVRTLLESKDPADLHISDLALHSIGIILYQKDAAPLFTELVRDVFGNGGIAILALASGDMVRVEQAAAAFRLDFDDAYQYVVAEKFSLDLISFDADFDRTDRKRILPADAR